MNNILLHRKDSIILTAIDIIDELGIQGLSTREIARRQEISEGTLFKHYKTKNDILLAVFDQFSLFDRDIMQSIKLKNLRSKEAVTYFINAYAEYYENYPAITAIGETFDLLSCNPDLTERVKDIFQNRNKFLIYLIEEAKNTGEIDGSTDSENLADVIYGLLKAICLKWRLSGKNFLLKRRILSTLEMVLNAFSK